MSEYWKSTPKYWCKFCSTYVRDTALEKKSHEATPKHQNNIQRSLRDIHKKTEREDREKQRAKDEVARLNGLVSGKQQANSSVASASQPSASKPKSTAPTGPASVAERKRQMEQLAAMGVAIPEEYRRDMSIQGEWSTVSETPVYARPVKSTSDDQDDDTKAFGVRKRKLDDEEEQDLKLAPKAWGSRLKSYPGASSNTEEDLDALLSGATTKKEVKSEASDLLKKEGDLDTTDTIASVPDIAEAASAESEVKAELNQNQDAPVVFKKRKSKR
ncbi:U1 zinc finger domain-containing protein, partial [Aureobasidium melanogenum]